MKTTTLPILGLGLFCIVQAAPAQRSSQTSPICIVGAGPAGLTAAANLEAKGYSTIVFEKQATVGGKCQAYYDDTFHPLGALFFTNVTYRETLKVINSVDVQSSLIGPSVGRSLDMWEYDYQTGAVAAAAKPSMAFKVLLAAEIARYTVQWAAEFGILYSEPNYKHGVPEHFAMSTQAWMKKNGYSALQVVFNKGMVIYGYGDIRETPILYMLQYFTPDVVVAIAGITTAHVIDFHAVWTQYAAKAVQGPIILNSTISKIDRSGALPILTFSANCPGPKCTSQCQTCNSLIMAFPPTMSALQAANLDTTPAETAVFSTIAITDYWSGAVSLDNIPTGQGYSASSIAPNLPPDAVGEPVGFIRLSETSNVVTSWSWAAPNTKVTTAQALDLLKKTLSKLIKTNNSTSTQIATVSLTDSDVKGFQKTDYFPHFNAEQLQAGIYDKLNALQGQKETYFASGLNGFETVEFAVRAGQSIVSQYF